MKLCRICGEELPGRKTAYCSDTCLYKSQYLRKKPGRVAAKRSSRRRGRKSRAAWDAKFAEAAVRYPSIRQPWTADMVSESTILRLAQRMTKLNDKLNG